MLPSEEPAARFIGKATHESEAPSMPSDSDRPVGWTIWEALRRTVDPDLMTEVVATQRTWREAGRPTDFTTGGKQRVGDTRQAAVQKVCQHLQDHLKAGRLIGWGRPQSPHADAERIPSAAWNAIVFDELNRSIAAEMASAKTAIYDIRVFIRSWRRPMPSIIWLMNRSSQRSENTFSVIRKLRSCVGDLVPSAASLLTSATGGACSPPCGLPISAPIANGLRSTTAHLGARVRRRACAVVPPIAFVPAIFTSDWVSDIRRADCDRHYPRWPQRGGCAAGYLGTQPDLFGSGKR